MLRPRPLRSAGFFGLHFDFHCAKDALRVGGRTTPAMVRAVLRTVRPDYVQIDCKGHPGISSYPTRVGIAAERIVRDQLAIWRRVTAAQRTPLVMHYSGVWDAAALTRHPAWAVRDPAGKAHARATSVFGPYADRLMIPQLIELGRRYGVDAVWVDGDCWSVALDWSRWSLAAWHRAGHRGGLPRTPKDPRWQAFVDHCREGFRAYLRHWTQAVHAACPACACASNWAFSSHMPEAVSAEVDYLSGDFAPAQSVQSARLQGRFLMGQGKPWDLMAWGFGSHHDGARCDKSAPQLCQEAAMVLSLGGGFQIYTNQQADGYVAQERLPVLAEVARFCRVRQDLCHGAAPVGQIGVLASHEDWRRRSGAPFPGNWVGQQPIDGVLRACLDARRHCEVILDHQLADRLRDLRVLVLPECRHLAPAVRRRIRTWLRAGGRVLAVGPHAVRALGAGLPLRSAAAPSDGIRYLRSAGRAGGADFTCLTGAWQPWRTGRGARVLTRMYPSNDASGPSWPGAVACRVGRGMVVAVACEFGRSQLERGSGVTTALVAGWLRQLDPRPLVEVEGPGRVEVVCMRKAGELRIHLINLEGPHEARNILVWEHIPALGSLRLRLRVPGRGAVRWEPEGIRLPGRRDRDHLVVEVPSIALHGAVCLREE